MFLIVQNQAATDQILHNITNSFALSIPQNQNDMQHCLSTQRQLPIIASVSNYTLLEISCFKMSPFPVIALLHL